MKNAIGIQLRPDAQTEGGLVYRNISVRAESVERLSVLDWYHILRMHYHWPLFQAIRFALWLAR